jgi:hypothetical protein
MKHIMLRVRPDGQGIDFPPLSGSRDLSDAVIALAEPDGKFR